MGEDDDMMIDQWDLKEKKEKKEYGGTSAYQVSYVSALMVQRGKVCRSPSPSLSSVPSRLRSS